MLGAGDRVPAARVWAGGEETTLGAVVATAPTPLALLCFFPFAWTGG